MQSETSKNVLGPLPDWWGRPDPLLVDAGIGGELLVAKVRILLLCLILFIPISSFVAAPSEPENAVGLSVTVAALLVAILIFLLVRRGMYGRWLAFASSALDVSMVSGALLVFLILDLPHTATNSKVVYEIYFLAIAATSLRYDVRVTLIAAFLAMAQYAAIVGYAAVHWDLNSDRFAPFPYGMFSWNAQVSRLILLGGAGLVSGAIVLRTRRLRQLSAQDRLTGLLNRGYFDARFVAEVERAHRYGRPLSVVMLDVDHFKRFNDTYGHGAGDFGLKIIADTIANSLRTVDIVARYGGEEFILLLPETPPSAAIEKIESLVEAVASAAIPLPRQAGITRLTISAGVAGLPGDGEEPNALIDAADARLFMAKDAGRNCVVGPDQQPYRRPNSHAASA